MCCGRFYANCTSLHAWVYIHFVVIRQISASEHRSVFPFHSPRIAHGCFVVPLTLCQATLYCLVPTTCTMYSPGWAASTRTHIRTLAMHQHMPAPVHTHGLFTHTDHSHTAPTVIQNDRRSPSAIACLPIHVTWTFASTRTQTRADTKAHRAM